MNQYLYAFCFFLLPAALYAQIPDSLDIEIYVYDQNGGGFLRDAEFIALAPLKEEQRTSRTNEKGSARLRLPRKTAYSLRVAKTGYKTEEILLNEKNATIDKNTWYIKAPMRRALGYMLDATMTDFVGDKKTGSGEAYGIEGATIEVYNNTLQREELRIVAHPHYQFNFFLQQGNEYIFMLRKKGYYTKRLRANVNANGCLLCMEGFGDVTPGVVDNLTANNSAGALITNISMKKIALGETVQVENIYYDSGSSELREEAKKQLDQLAEMLRDNPQIVIELGAHTDCRGKNERNKLLSQARADAVVRYLSTAGSVPPTQIAAARGYGEEKPLNSCVDGVECTDLLHQQNRRTEFTIVDIHQIQDDAAASRSLASIMQEANTEKILAATENNIFVAPTVLPTEGLHASIRQIELAKGALPELPLVLDANYTGYKIEVEASTTPPETTHPLFARFSPTYLYLDAEGTFSILLGQFSDSAQAESSLQFLRKNCCPSARIVQFSQGTAQN